VKRLADIKEFDGDAGMDQVTGVDRNTEWELAALILASSIFLV
jgi:hypothetical protein